MKIAAAYIRVSDERQTEYSPDSQLKLVRQYAQKNGYTIPKEYIFQDDGISARNAARRPAFNRMIATAKEKSHPFEAILVWKFSRFARNQEESIVFKSLLAKNGVTVISISEPIVDGAFGSLIERIIEWFDAFYLLNLSTEVKRGMTEKASRGEAMCQAPFGYDIREGKYYPNKDADTVRYIFSAFVGGAGMRRIATELAATGVRTYRGNPPDNRFIEYILHNPVYVGKIRWSTQGKMASSRQYDSEHFLIVPGKHEAIISQTLWEQAQAQLSARQQLIQPHSRTEQPADWMLKGIVRCGCCNATLVRRTAGVPYMQCHNYNRGTCTVSHCLSIAKANRLLLIYLESVLGDTRITIFPPSVSPASISLCDTKTLLEREQRKLKKIREAYIHGVDTLEEYTAAKEKIQQTLRELEEALNKEAEISAKGAIQYPPATIALFDLLQCPQATEQVKNLLLRTLLSHAVYNKSSEQNRIGKLCLYFL